MKLLRTKMMLLWVVCFCSFVLLMFLGFFRPPVVHDDSLLINFVIQTLLNKSTIDLDQLYHHAFYTHGQCSVYMQKLTQHQISCCYDNSYFVISITLSISQHEPLRKQQKPTWNQHETTWSQHRINLGQHRAT